MEPVKRLAIVQESGIQLFGGRYENQIREFVPHNDLEFGKKYVAKLNRKTDLPFYLAWVEVNIPDGLIEVDAAELAGASS